MQEILSKIKQRPVLSVNILFTFLSALTWLNDGIKFVWLAMWVIVPLMLASDKAFSCVVYMSLYMRRITNVKLFSILICIAFLIILVKEILNLNKNKLLNKYFKIIIYYILLLIIPLFYSVLINKLPNIQFIYCLNMLNLLILIYLLKNKFNFNLILIYASGIIASSALSIVLYLAGLSWFPFDAGNRFCAFMQLCNTLGVACVLCINLLYVLIVNGKLSRRSGFGLITALSIIGCSTLSKNFFIMFIITLTIILIHQFKQSKNRARAIKFFVFTLIVLSPILIYYGIVMLDRFFGDKSYSNIIDTISTGRLDKWLIYLKPWCKNIYSVIFGLGLCHNYNTPYSSHSFYIGYVSRLGIIGLIAIIGFVILILKGNSNKLRFKYLPLIILAIICIAEDVSHNTFNFVPAIMAMTPIVCYDKK